MHLIVMPNRINLLIFLIGLSCFIKTGLAQRGVLQGQQCFTPEKNIGQCLPLPNCTSIENVFNTYARIDTDNQNCGNEYFDGEPLVCCSVNQETLAPPIFLDPTPTTRVTFAPVPSMTPEVTNGQSKVGAECTGPHFKQGTCTDPPPTILTFTPVLSITPEVTNQQSKNGAECTGPDLKQGTCTDPPPTILTFTPVLSITPEVTNQQSKNGAECTGPDLKQGTCTDPPPTILTFTPVLSIPPEVTNRQSNVGAECTGPDFEQGTCTDPPPTTLTFTPVLSITPEVTNRQSKNGAECTGPDFEQGTCTPLAQCPFLIAQLQANPNDDTFVTFLKHSNKICDNEYSVVCCPIAIQVIPRAGGMVIFPRNTNEIPKKLPTMADGCGYVEKTNRKIVGGTASKVGSWPWIALIGYDGGVSTSPFKCGGALITSRHVLTAAHCIRSDLSFVRLGEHDLSTETEANHVDVPVVKNVRHPRYSKINGHNDIALLYLGQNVQFSEKITQICLPLEQRLRSKDITGFNPFVAGWGRTMEGGKSATVLQELQIPVLDNEVCKDKYKKQGKYISEEQFDSAVICAGYLAGGKDTCQGDSGGPLMLPEHFENAFRFHLIGVVSYGIGCARADVPGVYTRVTNFIDWIENGVADTP